MQQRDLFSSIVQLKVKHQLLHNYSFDDQTSMKILDIQRHTVNIRNSLIHQRKLLVYFLIHLRKCMQQLQDINGTFSKYSYIRYSRNIIWEIARNFIENFFRVYQEYIMEMFHGYSTNICLPGGDKHYIVAEEKSLFCRTYQYKADTLIYSCVEEYLFLDILVCFREFPLFVILLLKPSFYLCFSSYLLFRYCRVAKFSRFQEKGFITGLRKMFFTLIPVTTGKSFIK